MHDSSGSTKKQEKALRWNLTKLWQCALVTVALPDTGCSGTLVREVLICLLLYSRKASERGSSPQHLRNYHTNWELQSLIPICEIVLSVFHERNSIRIEDK